MASRQMCREDCEESLGSRGCIVAQVTAISDSEEEAMGRTDLVPFLLEDRIREVHSASLPSSSHQSHAARNSLDI